MRLERALVVWLQFLPIEIGHCCSICRWKQQFALGKFDGSLSWAIENCDQIQINAQIKHQNVNVNVNTNTNSIESCSNL